MTYKETLDYLFQQLPMFQRMGAAAYKADLSNTISLCQAVGNPHEKLRFVHVAGTNGKGSVSHMTASVLQEAGFKVGLYTSPHLRDFRERIKINGDMISEDAVVSFVDRFKGSWSSIEPSFFEITVAMAFWYFLEEEVDIVVLETGMGGRLDSTNVVRPEVSVITSIGFDHMQFLGDTIPKIAKEKAGIIKPTVPVIVGQLQDEAMQVMLASAESVKAPLYKAEQTTKIPPSDLDGPFAQENIRTAYTSLKVLRDRGWEISSDAVVKGFVRVVQNTGFLGRWQILNESPLTIADCAHNAEGLTGAMKKLSQYEYHNLHIIIGVSSDKDLSTVLPLFPQEANYYFAAANIPRAMPADELQEKALAFRLKGEKFSGVNKAYEAARLYATDRDLIYIGGSVFVVAEVV
ncbi:MAG: bifunctional folylpolyglutamate synthase/dihydrofolate synthase [Flavobacteriales bacterium]|nr:bifunctional folylpolyglutamate synthase/dihydrofolate synthase [Flavobacteriales bacterium]